MPLALDESLEQLDPETGSTELDALGALPSVTTWVIKPGIVGMSRAVALAGAARRYGKTVVITHADDGDIATRSAGWVARAVTRAVCGVAT